MKHTAFALIVSVMLAALPCRAGEPAPAAARAAIHWNADAARVEVTGLPTATLDALRTAPPDASVWPQRFGVYVFDAGKPATTPLLGAYALTGAAVTFTPRFPLRQGLTYRAMFDSDGTTGRTAITAEIAIAAEPAQAPAAVAAVYPSGNKLPENLLKFYIHFTAPMSRGEAYQRLHILDITDEANPREVPDAFLRLGEELWDAAGQRFTLLFDPGRIKRGLKPNEEMGAPLVAGRKYALVVDQDWRDAHGQHLAQPFRKEFLVTPFDDEQPDPQNTWPTLLPSAGNRDSILLGFPEPLDHALLQHAIVVKNTAGQEISGVVSTADHDRAWSFTPDEPWAAGDYELVVAPMLEDLAGNSVGRPFEKHSAATVDEGTSPDPVKLKFSIP